MLSLIIKISHIDYSAISSKVIPIILENKANVENPGKLIQILSKYKNLSGSTASAALKLLPQNIKDDISLYIIKSYDKQLIDAANNFMRNKQLDIAFKEIMINKTEVIEVAFNVDSINYNALISTAYPLLINKFSTNSKYDKLFTILEKLDGYSEKLIQATLETLSQDEKDELAICIISTYEEELISLINALTVEKGLKTTFSGAEVKII
jgi:hypothetical protein